MDRGMDVSIKLQIQSFNYIFFSSVFKTFDRDNDGQVNMLEWVVGLNTYLRGTLNAKIVCKSLFEV